VSSEELVTRVRDASRGCATAVSGHRSGSPAQVLAGLAEACERLGIEEWDAYGEGGVVTRLEKELVRRFGVEAAAFFPSGVMAQQAALRVHCERAASRRVAMPDLSHLLVHEEDGPRLLHRLEVLHLTRGFETPTAAHLEAVPGRLGAVLVELPLRDAGCLLPSWEELIELSVACRARGVALHVDGARIWEAQPWFGHPLDEIAEQADSLYVSFYKGLAGLAGAALLGTEDFVAEARLWRRRLGGTLYRATAEAVSALVGLHERLPLVPETVAWARNFAAALPTEVVTQPGVPQTNQFLLFTAGDADTVNARTAAIIEEHRIGLPPWFPSRQPGRIQSEVVVTPAALTLDPARMAAQVANLLLAE
jgi:threonine aldolase